MAAPNTAIYYHPDAYRADREQVMGRHAAGAGFLEGFVKHSDVDAFVGLAANPHRRGFVEHIGQIDDRDRPVNIVEESSGDLADVGTLFLPGPDLSERAWQRRFQGDSAYSLCGVTHTLSSRRIIKSLQANILAPTYFWDALICTSRAARSAVEYVLDSHREYMCQRFGRCDAPAFELPIIPLGVDAERMGRLANSGSGAMLRDRLGIETEHVVALFAGRLSFHSKAHPVPMLIALERAQKRLLQEGKKIHLVLAGQFYNDAIRKEFDATLSYSPNVQVHQIDGTDNEAMNAAWCAADFFISLSDNIQETFGLTPVEAMAAGLPVIASDWDGYRDTVVDGETGLLIPTAMNAPDVGADLASGYGLGQETYDRFIGAAAMATSVDIGKTVEAIVQLSLDAELRSALGTAGKVRAQECYDWSVIIAQYQALWSELADRRSGSAPGSLASPLSPNPFAMFAAHASEQVDAVSSVVALQESDALADLWSSSINTFAAQHMLDRREMECLLDCLQGERLSVAELLANLPEERREAGRFALLWMAKFGLIAID